MKAEIWRTGINWFINYYDENDVQIGVTDWVSGFNEDPMRDAIRRAENFRCKTIIVQRN